MLLLIQSHSISKDDSYSLMINALLTYFGKEFYLIIDFDFSSVILFRLRLQNNIKVVGSILILFLSVISALAPHWLDDISVGSNL